MSAPHLLPQRVHSKLSTTLDLTCSTISGCCHPDATVSFRCLKSAVSSFNNLDHHYIHTSVGDPPRLHFFCETVSLCDIICLPVPLPPLLLPLFHHQPPVDRLSRCIVCHCRRPTPRDPQGQKPWRLIIVWWNMRFLSSVTSGVLSSFPFHCCTPRGFQAYILVAPEVSERPMLAWNHGHACTLISEGQ